MKKIFALLCAVIILSACSTLNKNTLSYRMSKVEGEKYLSALGSGSTKDAAKTNAKEEMRKMLTSTNAGSMPIVADLYNQAFIKDSWKEKNQKKYYAIAVVERKVAKGLLENNFMTLDNQISGLAKNFELEADKFVRIKTAMKIQPLLERRNGLQDLYQLLDFNGLGYQTEKYSSLKNIVYNSMNSVKISLTVLGANSEVLHTHVINALNEMGLSVAINEKSDISIDVNSEIDDYPSKKVDGLMWAQATASIGLKDMDTGGVFARFSISERQGASRASDAIRRTMDDIGKRAEGEIKTRLYNYLEKR
ncbi:hypothetical protein Dip518_000799 [Parelusimicrobium proximum]|uniref:hypothetical protein n=1 Tax=Parelusimicrobium proximum TaxID=3228953 RepID=UPI003D17F7F2